MVMLRALRATSHRSPAPLPPHLRDCQERAGRSGKWLGGGRYIVRLRVRSALSGSITILRRDFFHKIVWMSDATSRSLGLSPRLLFTFGGQAKGRTHEELSCKRLRSLGTSKPTTTSPSTTVTGVVI